MTQTSKGVAAAQATASLSGPDRRLPLVLPENGDGNEGGDKHMKRIEER
jgi:hypothetical protein